MKADITRSQEKGGNGAIIYDSKVPGWLLWVAGVGLIIVGFNVPALGLGAITGIALLAFTWWDMRRAKKGATTWHIVTVHVQFTEEENQVIKENKLDKNITVLEMENGVDDSMEKDDLAHTHRFGDVSMYTLTHGEFSRKFSTPLRAKKFEEEITAVLPDVKGYVAGNIVEEGDEGTKSLEF